MKDDLPQNMNVQYHEKEKFYFLTSKMQGTYNDFCYNLSIT